MAPSIADPLTLPCGAVLPNRICKAALTEGLADSWNRATPELCRLYRAWSLGGSGLVLTGNVQVDRRYLERPGNVAIDGVQTEEQLTRLRDWARAATEAGNHCWVQLGHAGRQCNIKVNKVGVAPSAVASRNLGGKSKLMPSFTPRALTAVEIKDVIQRFAFAASVCKEVGFTGVQLHAAHGYLISSFLNPSANRRQDEYGGSLENRARVLLESVAAVRAVVGPAYPIGVKFNTSDFTRGGFSLEDALALAKMLDEAGVDLLEVSGGNYENPAMLGGANAMDTTTIREAYFLEYAEGLKRSVSKVPLMLTGGMRSRSVMEQVLREGHIAVIGVGRPLCGMPDCAKLMLEGKIDILPRYENSLQLPGLVHGLTQMIGGKVLRHFLIQLWYYRNEIALGLGQPSDRDGNLYNLLYSAYWVESWDDNQAKKLEGLSCRGTIHKAPTSKARVLLIAVLMTGLLAKVWRWWAR